MKKFILCLLLFPLAIFGKPNMEGNKNPEGTPVKFTGRIISYGSEPHTVVMIKDLDNNLYYPKGELQGTLKELSNSEYIFEGILLEPIEKPILLIPKHTGTFENISWEEIVD